MTRHHSLRLRAMLDDVASRSIRGRGLLVLVLWQVPVQPVIRPDGSFGFMLGGGSDEHATLSCEGDLISSERVQYRVAAMEADYSLTPVVRVAGAAGFMDSDRSSHNGVFTTVQVRADWKSVGLGAGAAISPAFDEFRAHTTAWPSVYVRAGSAEGLHLRGDVYPPTAFAAQHIARLGLGFNAVLRDQPSGFIGVAVVGSLDAASGVAAELTIPMAKRVALKLEGHYGDGHGYPVRGLAAGGRFLLGSSPSASASLH